MSRVAELITWHPTRKPSPPKRWNELIFQLLRSRWYASFKADFFQVGESQEQEQQQQQQQQHHHDHYILNTWFTQMKFG